MLRSEELAEVFRAQRLKIGFLPHPNLQSALPHFDLPTHVLPLTYEGTDVQELFARAAAVVTDYSSIAFNAAYIDRPVVYFQFDADRVLAGGHVGRKGYFSYESDGFGPLTRTVGEAQDAIAKTLRNGRSPEPVYQERIHATFPNRDGRCCERVTQAIEASVRRFSRA